MPSRSLAYSVVCAVASMLVLSTGAHREFDRVRHLVVTTPQRSDTTSSIVLPDLTSLAGSPAALVLRASADEPSDITVLLDSEVITRFSLEPNHVRRVDASFTAPPGTGHRIALIGSATRWTLEYLEVANVHGFSRGLISLVIVPSARTTDSPLPFWLLAPLFVGLLAAGPRWGWPGGGVANLVCRAGSVLALALLVATLLAGVLTPYKVLLALSTWAMCVAGLYAYPLSRAWQHIERRRPLLLGIPPVVAALAVVFLFSVGRFYERETGFTTLIAFGEAFRERALPVLDHVPHAVEPGFGYDGQFYAQLALDPFLRSESIKTAVDAPAYRARRILMPWMAAALGMGDPRRVLEAYSLLNVISWLVLGWLLLRWLPAGSRRAAFSWAACMFSAGLLASVRLALPDGPSMLLIALGMMAAERGRGRLATAILAVAGLARETNVLGGVALLSDHGSTWSNLRRWAVIGALVTAPIVVWCSYFWTVGISPLDTGARAFGWPLAGYAEEWAGTLHRLSIDGWASEARFSFLSQVALTTRACWLLVRPQWQNVWWRTGAVYLGLVLVLGPAGWEGDPGAVTRVGLPLTFAFNMLLPASRYYWPLWVVGNADLLHGLHVLNVSPGLTLFNF